MVLKKLRSPIYILLLLLLSAVLFVMQSCEEKTQRNFKSKSRKAEIDRLTDLGDNYFKKGVYDSSFYYFNKAHSACDVKEDLPEIIYALSNMATIQQNQGDYAGSEATISEALPYLKPTTKVNCLWNIYTILGNNCNYTADYSGALYYFNKALALKTKEILKIGIQNNIALTLMEQKDFHKALQILSPLILKKEVINNAETYSRILDNLGTCYFKVGNPKAFAYLNQSLIIRENNKDNWGLIASYYNLSEFYKNNNLRISNKYAHLAYRKATMLNSIDSRLQCLELLIQNSTKTQTKGFSLQYLHINDSIKRVRQKAKNQFAKIKYDFKKEKDENVELKAQKLIQLEQQKNKNLLIYFISIIAFAIALFIYYYLNAKNKREKLKSSYSTEIRIAKRLHDELANDVYQTMTFAETQDLSASHNKEILLNNLDTIYSRTRNISKENSIVETGLHFLSNIKEMMSGFNTDTTHIIMNGLDAINWSSIENPKKIALYRVLQELLVNMKKHSKSSLVVLSFKINENKIHLNYTDNGVGVPFDKINLKNGLRNVENRIHAIKGTVTFDTQSNNGFKVHITFPT